MKSKQVHYIELNSEAFFEIVEIIAYYEILRQLAIFDGQTLVSKLIRGFLQNSKMLTSLRYYFFF